MMASKISRETLERAAHEVGVRIEIDTKNAAGTRHRVKLFPDPPPTAYTKGGRRRPGDEGDAPYQRESTSMFTGGRRVHAVCWHGFRDFFRTCYQYEPDAVFRTAVDTWRGSEDFEARYRGSGHHNIGAPICPVSMADACRCPERGYAG
jgi:hypothetical protein